MPIQEIALSDQEKQILEEAQELLGLNTLEETIAYLDRERIQEMLAKLAGQEIKSKRHFF